MRKMVVNFLIFISSAAYSLVYAAGARYPNDPRLYYSVDEINNLKNDPGSLYWIIPGSEINIDHSKIFVIYTSEGSGIIHVFSYVYQCRQDGGCRLIAVAHAPAEGSERLRHKFNRKKKSITFFQGSKKILTVNI